MVTVDTMIYNLAIKVTEHELAHTPIRLPTPHIIKDKELMTKSLFDYVS